MTDVELYCSLYWVVIAFFIGYVLGGVNNEK